MQVVTASGAVTGSRRSRYMQWLAGWVASGAWSGHGTVRAAWETHRESVLASRGPATAYAMGMAAGTESVYHSRRIG